MCYGMGVTALFSGTLEHGDFKEGDILRDQAISGLTNSKTIDVGLLTVSFLSRLFNVQSKVQGQKVLFSTYLAKQPYSCREK